MKQLKLAVYTLALAGILAAGCKGGKKEKEAITDLPEMEAPVVAGLHVDTVQFASTDGLEMNAVVYTIDSSKPVIVLCHQARMSNYEYAEIAPKLAAMGYNCVALDQRAGGAMESHENMTNKNALAKNLSTKYTDALPDIEAGVNYAAARFNQPVTLWGSSYSASLTLKVAMDNANVKQVVTFSPILKFDDGSTAEDYFKNYKTKPIFMTSTEKEAGPLTKAMAHLGDDVLYQYYPDMKGTHGSKALWSSDEASENYWAEITKWLAAH
ncbi:MAG: alpha/beta hydrolase [Bacteroidetes bacterium]|nr:alpha/beta hydrolase [Bacteroidota bacterium]